MEEYQAFCYGFFLPVHVLNQIWGNKQANLTLTSLSPVPSLVYFIKKVFPEWITL